MLAGQGREAGADAAVVGAVAGGAGWDVTVPVALVHQFLALCQKSGVRGRRRGHSGLLGPVIRGDIRHLLLVEVAREWLHQGVLPVPRLKVLKLLDDVVFGEQVQSRISQCSVPGAIRLMASDTRLGGLPTALDIGSRRRNGSRRQGYGGNSAKEGVSLRHTGSPSPWL